MAEAVVAAQQPHDHAERLVLAVTQHHRIDAEGVGVGGSAPGPEPNMARPSAHVVELHDALGDVERVVVRQAGHTGAELDAVGALRRAGQEHLGRGDRLPTGRVVLSAPELVEAEPVEVGGEVEVALELQRRVLADRMVGGEERPKRKRAMRRW